MRKRVILALMLAAAMLLSSGCGLIVKDEEVDRQTTIIEVAGKTYTKGEIAREVEATLDTQEYFYSMYYGMPFDKTDDKNITAAQDMVIEQLIQMAVVEQKGAEMGMDVLTEAELAEVTATVQTNFDSFKESVKTTYFADTTLEGEELETAMTQKMTELGYSDFDTLLENEKLVKIDAKLRADVVKDVAVSDEEVQTAYDTRVANAQTNYATNPGAYGTEATNGQTVYYAPAGYRYVKNLLLKFSDEDSTAISAIEADITAKNTQLGTVGSSLTELGEDASADTEERAASRKELESTKSALTKEVADLQAKLDEAKETAYAKLQPTLDEINGKITEGIAFDELIAQYGQDEGAKTSPEGYLVSEGSTNWVAEFTQAAMAIEKIGGISPAVRTSFGIHLLQYAGDVTEGAVPLDTVKEAIFNELLTQKQDELYNSTVQGWVTEANAKIDRDRLN